jgi:outer membrane protein assembly factor BamB
MAVFVALLVAISCGGSTAAPTTSQSTATSASHVSAPLSRKKRHRAAAWLTYHANLARAGVDTTSPRLGHLRKAWTTRLDGQVYAEPLAVGRRVFAATENNTVYALSARTGRVIWRSHLGAPMQASALPCGNISPVTGITGTPAISGSTIYAVAYLGSDQHVLFALRLSNGSIRFQRAVDAPGADPKVHQERAALSVSKGRVYVPYGGLFGDCGEYKGRVVSVPTSGNGGNDSFTVGVSREGGIWAPSGAAADRAGNLYVSTGNGESSGFDFGDSVLRLSPSLHQTSFFRPPNGGHLNSGDTDLGSVGPTLVGHQRLFAIGKEGVGVLLSTANLGGVGGQLDQKKVCDSAFGGLAYEAPLLYVPCTDGLVALRIGGHRFSVAWRGGPDGPPIVAGGAVWSIDSGSGTLEARAARSGRLLASANLGAVNHFATPSAGGGHLFAPAGDSVVAFTGV